MWLTVFFILGTLFGSLGSVLLYRLDKDCSRQTIKSILIGRSHDIHSHKKLKRYQLIPIVSRLIQGGKSTHTNEKLPTLYITLEVVSGIVFATTYQVLHSAQLINIQQGIGRDILIFWLGTNWFLTLLSLRDNETLTLHIPLRILNAIWLTARLLVGDILPLSYSLSAGLGLVILFLIIYFLAARYAQQRYQQDEGFGEGDVWFAGIIGPVLPCALLYHSIGLSAFTLSFLLMSYLTISASIGVILYYLQSLVHTYHYSSNRSSRQSSQKTQPTPIIAFFPAMTLGLRITIIFFNHLYT